MRVELTTIEDFCSELAIEAAAGKIYENVVRLRVDRTPEQEEEISFLVGLWATALVGDDPGLLKLLEFGVVASESDDERADAGSQIVEGWRQKVLAVADEHGLHVRAGKIELY